MSLNGLDEVKVKEVHDAASGEPGGWFLLKYASRDEIDVLDSGNGGITEIRAAIGRYEEESPLYGFLKYRRRSVVIKYMPEACSRLVQARAAVHFTAVCDRFTHNTTFEIGDAKDLKDSKLSAACSLHAASGSSSSSTSSLRRRRLNEIAEEEEEEERERKRQSIVKEEERPTSSVYSDSPALPSSPEPPVVLDRLQITNPSETDFASTKSVPDFTGSDAPTSPSRSEFAGRLSSQSARYEGYSSSLYSQGKKVKLGPRPSIETHKRPLTTENFRPIAALPAGFKFFKGSKKGKTQEQGHSEGEGNIKPSTAPAPDSLRSPDDQLPPRPATSSGASVKSVASSIAPVREAKITPEKARLMKAMKLREKKIQDAKLELTQSAEITVKLDPSLQSTQSLSVSSDANPTADSPDSSSTVKPEENCKDTVLDSHPSSPGAASSTCIGDSTKASSLSDLADDTIQASKDSALDMHEEANEDTERTDVSAGTLTKNAEESVKIPEGDRNNVHPTTSDSFTPTTSTHSQVQNDIAPATGITTNAAPEHNHDTTQEPLNIPPSNSSTSPTTPSLKSKFSRTDITVPTDTPRQKLDEPATILPAADDNQSESQDKTGPEILLASPPNPSRQKVTIEPIRTDLPLKDTNQVRPPDTLDDDALMDELHAATVHEAKPMLVSKSPITPVFPNSGSPPRKDALLPRAASNPLRSSLLMPVEITPGNNTRSVSSGSAPHTTGLTRNASNASVQSKKGGVGSSISQRIKALEALSGSTPVEEKSIKPLTPSATFFGVRKQSTRDGAKSSSVVDRADSPMPPPPAPERSRDPNAHTDNTKRERSSSVASKLNMFEGQNPPRGSPESAQANVIRGMATPISNLTNTPRKPSDGTPPDFRQPTVLVDIQRAQSVSARRPYEKPSVAERPKTGVSENEEEQPAPEAAEKQGKRRSSISLMKNFIKEHTPLSSKSAESSGMNSPASLNSPNRPPSVLQTPTSSFARRLSTSSRRSSITHDREGDNGSISGATRSSSRLSDSGSADDDKSLSDKKSKNRTSRFMRRLSNSFGGARKAGGAGISPTVAEEEADQLEKAPVLVPQPTSSPTIVAFMGDVNVQFPDNLLWKRRSMSLDAQGFLLLTTVQGGAKKAKESSVGAKRFHLSDFRKPYIPDVEVQELPNSVVLDFTEGSCLQIACGDRTEQQNVLRILQEAHQSHASH